MCVCDDDDDVCMIDIMRNIYICCCDITDSVWTWDLVIYDVDDNDQ